MKYFLKLVAVVFVAVVLVGCGQGLGKPKLKGTWTSNKMPDVSLVFLDDKMARLTSGREMSVLEYSIEGDHVFANAPVLGRVVLCKIVDNNTLLDPRSGELLTRSK